MEHDESMRMACFLALDVLRARHGDELPVAGGLSEGFNSRGTKIPFLNVYKGIHRAKAQSGPAALSIQTSYKRPYDDETVEDGFLYAYRAGPPDQADNRALRYAFVLGVPIVYFVATRPGWFQATYPCYITDDDPSTGRVLVTPGQMVGPMDEREPEPIDQPLERKYAVRATRVRLHQGRFRGQVLNAYSDRCTICRLRETRLLDAAHIIGDLETEGAAVIANGLALCSIHHRAYDKDLVGVSPDYEVHIARELTEEQDGPMLEVLKEAQGRTIELPAKRTWRPDRDRLALRFDRFSAAS